MQPALVPSPNSYLPTPNPISYFLSPKIMKARHGKIASLPKEIRDQLNHRLKNGWRGARLANWLNELPQVKEVLPEQFHGGATSFGAVSGCSRAEGPQCYSLGWSEQCERRPRAQMPPIDRGLKGKNILKMIHILKVSKGLSKYIKVNKGGIPAIQPVIHQSTDEFSLKAPSGCSTFMTSGPTECRLTNPARAGRQQR